MIISTYLADQCTIIDAALDRWTPAETEPPAIIHRAMRYSLFAGGKRIRPILAMASARTVGEEMPGLADVACTLELIHTYSLIHDDLPALDNDDLRRGRPTSHKVFGEAMAILAGDALLTLAFLVLAAVDGTAAETRVQLVRELSLAAGTVRGMIGGQVHDLDGEGKTPTPERLDQIHRAKTGALLRASVRMGAIHAGANDDELRALTEYGEHVGLAFQIIDDILDVEQSSAAIGKTAGKDAVQGKITFPAVYGLKVAREMAETERLAAHAAISRFGERGSRLRDLADLIVDREA